MRRLNNGEGDAILMVLPGGFAMLLHTDPIHPSNGHKKS
jgi:hypothetical protein